MKTITHLRTTLLLSLPIAACLLGVSTAARADEETLAGSFYFSADLGASMIADATFKSSTLIFPNETVEFDPGARLNLGFGYHITDWLAAELETGILLNFTSSFGDEIGRTHEFIFFQMPVLANLVYHIPTRSRFRPFIGAGVGGVNSVLEDFALLGNDVGTDSDFGLAWQASAGVRYRLSSKVELGLVYKYLGATERSFGAFNAKMEGTQTHSVSASVSLKF